MKSERVQRFKPLPRKGAEVVNFDDFWTSLPASHPRSPAVKGKMEERLMERTGLVTVPPFFPPRLFQLCDVQGIESFEATSRAEISAGNQ
jgi:hypothetical protein